MRITGVESVFCSNNLSIEKSRLCLIGGVGLVVVVILYSVHRAKKHNNISDRYGMILLRLCV